MGNYKFDIDIIEGEFAERMIKELLEGQRGTIEVKRDFKVTETGNLALEYEYRGRKSGLAKTEATWWAIVLDGERFAHQMVILIKTERLKELGNQMYKKGYKVPGGDNKASKLVLLPLPEIIQYKPDKPIQPDFL